MELIFPLIIILIVALFIYLAWYNSSRQKGKRGEMRVSILAFAQSVVGILLNETVNTAPFMGVLIIPNADLRHNDVTFPSFPYYK